MSRRTRQITTESPLGLRFSENNAAILKFRSPLPPLEMALDIGLFGREMARRSAASAELAERVGFEPTVRFPAHTLSKRAP